ncbi:TetR/AcrR family transcriptional regulator [Oceanobacillus kapialis]|uniref:TetR/AcrR family transcriptional regulator n=1 Tax=Oceanobacillus kapialis TaxID=481353 RepID=UPI00384B634B
MVQHDRRIDKTQRALKAALIKLMEEKDIRQITVTEIVKEADVNRGTFYKHYEVKEDLLEATIQDVIESLIQAYRYPYLSKEAFTMEDLSASKIKLFEHVATYSDFYRVIMLHPEVLPGFQNRLCDVLKKLSLQDLAFLQKTHNVDVDLQASYQSHALFGMIFEWVKGGFKYTPEHMAEQLMEILSNQPFSSGYQTILNK